ncbi:MAG: phosphotransferase [bacterium]|nr:phosphotransferase [bacterium]
MNLFLFLIFVVDFYHRVYDIQNMKKIFEGDSAEVYDYDEKTVLKLFKNEGYGNSREFCEYEFNILNLLYQNQFPVPAPFRLFKHNNRFGFLMQRINGDSLKDLIANNNSVDTYSSLLGNYHKLLHSKIIDNNNIPFIKDILIQHLNNLKTDFFDIKDQLISIFNSINTTTVLTHGDFAPNNILLENDTVYIIDWPDLMYGDNYADIARTILFLTDDYNPHIGKYFLNSNEKTKFIKNYIHVYFKDDNNFNSSKLTKWLVINSVLEYTYMEIETQHTEFSNKMHNFVYKFMENNDIDFFEQLC